MQDDKQKTCLETSKTRGFLRDMLWSHCENYTLQYMQIISATLYCLFLLVILRVFCISQRRWIKPQAKGRMKAVLPLTAGKVIHCLLAQWESGKQIMLVWEKPKHCLWSLVHTCNIPPIFWSHDIPYIRSCEPLKKTHCRCWPISQSHSYVKAKNNDFFFILR